MARQDTRKVNRILVQSYITSRVMFSAAIDKMVPCNIVRMKVTPSNADEMSTLRPLISLRALLLLARYLYPTPCVKCEGEPCL
jgi:hypothetical protein